MPVTIVTATDREDRDWEIEVRVDEDEEEIIEAIFARVRIVGLSVERSLEKAGIDIPAVLQEARDQAADEEHGRAEDAAVDAHECRMEHEAEMADQDPPEQEMPDASQ